MTRGVPKNWLALAKRKMRAEVDPGTRLRDDDDDVTADSADSSHSAPPQWLRRRRARRGR